MSTAFRKSPSGNRWLDILPHIIFTLMGLIGLSVIVLIFGRVHGEEFSPEAFQRRRYRFYQIPLLRLQISPVVHETTSSSFEIRIAKDLQAVNANHPSATWDIVTSERAGRSIYNGDARILCDYLSIQNDKQVYIWEKWTDDHQDLAAVFWPVVADVARARLYVLIPELLEMASLASSPTALTQSLSDYVETESLDIALSLQKNNQHGYAVRAFELALKQNPESAEAMQGRARSQAELRQEESKAASNQTPSASAAEA